MLVTLDMQAIGRLNLGPLSSSISLFDETTDVYACAGITVQDIVCLLLFLNRYIVGSVVKSGTNCFFKLTNNPDPMHATKNVVYLNQGGR